MKKNTIAVLAVLTAVLSSAGAYAQEDKGIYGADDRQDYFQVSEARRRLADSTVAFFKAGSVSADGKLALENFGEKAQLCKKEPFREQPIGAFCSGSLVAPDLVMTAGHCVKDSYDCANAKMVFGYAIKEQGKNPSGVDPSEVYSCKGIVAREQENGGADYAIIKLDRPVPNHEPLQVNREGGIKEGTRLFVIGHPVGLPVKVAGNAWVRSVYGYSGYFQANLDTYGGNSGSAVFNEETGMIEGILVRGGTDFQVHSSLFGGKCRVSVKVGDSEGRGEDVTSVSKVLQYIPLPGQESPTVETPVNPNVATMLGNCQDPGAGASIAQLMAYVDCLTAQLNNNKP
ncbi:MAG: serine protease [Elusimicrobia bacterium]|nr:serine protease [Elusimicrobiota bacterium]